MAVLTSVLTWAVPLNYDELVPSLRAYTKIKPAQDELRRCNRSTENVPVAKLPAEIIDMIVQLLMNDASYAESKPWHVLRRCYQGDCDYFDHMSSEQKRKVKDEIREDQKRIPLGTALTEAHTAVIRLAGAGDDDDDEDVDVDEEFTHYQRLLHRLDFGDEDDLAAYLLSYTHDPRTKLTNMSYENRQEYLSYATLRNEDGSFAFHHQHFVRGTHPVLNNVSKP